MCSCVRVVLVLSPYRNFQLCPPEIKRIFRRRGKQLLHPLRKTEPSHTRRPSEGPATSQVRTLCGPDATAVERSDVTLPPHPAACFALIIATVRLCFFPFGPASACGYPEIPRLPSSTHANINSGSSGINATGCMRVRVRERGCVCVCV